MTELERLVELTIIEREFWEKDIFVAGMDEVGRGPFAGPVVACCAVMPKNPLVEYVNDSKKLTAKRREAVFEELIKIAKCYALGWVDAKVIDEIGIALATRRAFETAFAGVELPITDVLVDAVKNLDIPASQQAFIRGDSISYSIASASIIAKVERDRFMETMDHEYPQYGFKRNKGYGTPEHIAAIKEYGPCPLHRLSFIKNYVV